MSANEQSNAGDHALDIPSGNESDRSDVDSDGSDDHAKSYARVRRRLTKKAATKDVSAISLGLFLE